MLGSAAWTASMSGAYWVRFPTTAVWFMKESVTGQNDSRLEESIFEVTYFVIGPMPGSQMHT